LSAAYLIVRKRNLTLHRVKKTAQAWKIISFAGITRIFYKVSAAFAAGTLIPHVYPN